MGHGCLSDVAGCWNYAVAVCVCVCAPCICRQIIGTLVQNNIEIVLKTTSTFKSLHRANNPLHPTKRPRIQPQSNTQTTPQSRGHANSHLEGLTAPCIEVLWFRLIVSSQERQMVGESKSRLIS